MIDPTSSSSEQAPLPPLDPNSPPLPKGLVATGQTLNGAPVVQDAKGNQFLLIQYQGQNYLMDVNTGNLVDTNADGSPKYNNDGTLKFIDLQLFNQVQINLSDLFSQILFLIRPSSSNEAVHTRMDSLALTAQEVQQAVQQMDEDKRRVLEQKLEQLTWLTQKNNTTPP